jgi:hypothetical protein
MSAHLPDQTGSHFFEFAWVAKFDSPRRMYSLLMSTDLDDSPFNDLRDMKIDDDLDVFHRTLPSRPEATDLNTE